MAPIKKRSNIRAKIASKSRATSAPNSFSAVEAATSSFDASTDSPSEFASFAPSKKDKRTIKHSAFVSKIEKAGSRGKKRSRGVSKRLATQLGGLVDALPEIEGRQSAVGKKNSGDGSDDDDDWEGMSEDETVPASATNAAATWSEGQGDDMLGALAGMVNIRPSIKKAQNADESEGKMKMKTLKSNRGQAKRKQKLEGREMERFAKNLAQMSRPTAAAAGATPAASSAGGAGAGAPADRWAALRGFIGQTMEKNPNFGKAA